MEGKLRLEEVSRIENMNKIMNEVKEDKLKKRYRRKIVQENKVKEEPWLNEDIRRGIKERKELNRRKRI